MVKRKRSISDHRQLLLTNRVEFKSSQFQSALELTQAGDRAPAILVARLAQQGTLSRYFIIDGNHRAVAHAYLNRPVPYFLIQSKEDIDWILECESEGGIAQFPIRDFLSGNKDFITMLGEAMVASACEGDGYSAFDVAYRFVREMHVPPDTKPDKLESKQVAENIERCKFVLLKNGEPWLPAAQSSMVDNESNERAKTARADVSLPERKQAGLQSQKMSLGRSQAHPYGKCRISVAGYNTAQAALHSGPREWPAQIGGQRNSMSPNNRWLSPFSPAKWDNPYS